MEAGSPPLWLVTEGGGNMECMPCKMALLAAVRFLVDMSLVAPMKSSTYTSNIVVGWFGAWLLFCSLLVGGVGGSMCCSKGCFGRCWCGIPSYIVSMTSLAVSVAVQKSGGDSHHPIWRLVGTTISMSSSGVLGSSGGRT